VPAEGGPVVGLPLPEVAHLAFDPAGGAESAQVAYTPLRPAFRTWKRYRGGRVSPIWLTDLTTLETRQAPHVKASDAWPCFAAGSVWFASDRGSDGDLTMNVWRWTPGEPEAKQVTRFTGFDVRNLSAGGGVLVLEQAGALHLLDPATGATERLTIRVRHDGLQARRAGRTSRATCAAWPSRPTDSAQPSRRAARS
jgi:tricorn protease